MVLGASGQLGHALVKRLGGRLSPGLAPSRRELDLVDTDAVAAFLERWAPDAIVNAAGFTDVVLAESPPVRETVFRLNRDLPATLARTCHRLGMRLLHVSTDFVFDGERGTPYRESDSPRPMQVYGLSKLAGENEVLSRDPGALVVRTSTLFGPAPRPRPNFVDAVLARARSLAVIDVVEPPVSSPTYAPDLAEALLGLLEGEVSGLLHVTNSGQCTRFELATAVVEAAGLAHRVRVVPRTTVADAIRRPAYSVLDTSRYASVAGAPLRSWREALAAHLEARDS